MNVNLSIGVIIEDVNSKKKYRIVSLTNEICTLCNMDTTKFELILYSIVDICDLISENLLIIKPNEKEIFDINTLPESAKQKLILKKQMMNEILQLYRPSYIGLMGKTSRPELKEVMEKYHVKKANFWKICIKYFQSGFKDISLVDKRYLGSNKGKSYNLSAKPGAKSEYFESTGVIKNDEIESYYEEALKDYKSGRQKTIRSAYDKMNLKHFSKVEIINGIETLVLLPESERPTIRQFRYYVNTHTSKEEIDRIKTSAQEQRNNKRLIVSDVLKDVYGPGDMVEIDAVEADVSLVSELDHSKTIGRPVNYFMVDVFTRCIVAVSVAFDNNSMLGLTNLFLNLADDKKQYAERFGISFENTDVWPSNFIPRRLRVDRGSDFKSKEFNRICVTLGIEKHIVPGGSGSLKGVVEQSFHQMHSQQNVHLENYGLIEKRHDSNHHKEATLTIYEYTQMIINFVLFHNQQYDKDYHLTKEMIQNGIEPIPAKLWQYGVNKYGYPRPIPVLEQYLYDLMTPVKAKISRRGISYKNLWYLPFNDSELAREMFSAGTKKIPFEVRIDKRDVGAVYYKRGNRLIYAPLNQQITGNADYAGMTYKEYEDFRKAKGSMDAHGKVYNEQLSANLYVINESIVSSSKKDNYSDETKMRKNREEQKQLTSKENNIKQRFVSTDDGISQENKSKNRSIANSEDVSTKNNENYEDYDSFQDAIEAFNDEF